MLHLQHYPLHPTQASKRYQLLLLSNKINFFTIGSLFLNSQHFNFRLNFLKYNKVLFSQKLFFCSEGQQQVKVDSIHSFAWVQYDNDGIGSDSIFWNFVPFGRFLHQFKAKFLGIAMPSTNSFSKHASPLNFEALIISRAAVKI